MIVYINGYKDHWISPYTILDYAFFWTEWSKCNRNKSFQDSIDVKNDTKKFVERPEWVDKWADRLEPISCVIRWVWDKIDRKIDYVKIDRWDTWSMDHTLSYIILPMLKQLQIEKNGAPFVDDEDVPEELKSTSAPPKKNDWDTDDNHFKRWDYVLDEMIFAFEHKIDDSWEEAFYSGKTDWIWEHVNKDEKEGPMHTYKCDLDGMKIVQNRMQNGFRLFGKYYCALWD